MKTITIDQPINLRVLSYELDFTQIYQPKPKIPNRQRKIKIQKVNFKEKHEIPPAPNLKNAHQKRDVRGLIEDLLSDIYADHRHWSSSTSIEYSIHGSTTAASASSHSCDEQSEGIELIFLETLDVNELRKQIVEWDSNLKTAGERLAKCLRQRDRLWREQRRLCSTLTAVLRHITGDANARFGLTPGTEGPGEGGFAEWLHAMRLVARLPAGVPQHFRRKLWLTLAERHLTARGIDWQSAERACFRGTAQPDDNELSAQILKDLHRTGCSLFCGAEGRENQAMLRRVLLAYARWNKEVGYCQGFNMLAAIILEVMEKSESDSLKVMVYLVEAVLPEGYFADDLRGLSADMAAFRDLLRLRLPRLANHMDHLQRISDGGGIEPPLPDVFTMQWFLTLYATWLPRESLLRIWDLVLLDGNEILLLTALAIWDMLQDRILSARSADEFYSCMGGGAGAVWAAGEALVARVVALGAAPELPRLRSLHRYRVTPPAPSAISLSTRPPVHAAMQSMTKKGLRLFYSEDEGDSSDDGNKMALATVIPKRDDRSGTGDRLSLDIGALKRQYARLRERQRQAHVILAAACARHAAVGVPTSPTSLTVNNLLLGKSAIVSSRGRRLGPPPGAIPPSRQTSTSNEAETRSRRSSIETISWEGEKSRKTFDRRNSVQWKDIKKQKDSELTRKASIDLDEIGDGTIVSEHEANEIIASIRSRSSSESSSYSSHSKSSTDTSLCDEKDKESDSEIELPNDDKENIERLSTPSIKNLEKKSVSPRLKESKAKTTIQKNEVTSLQLKDHNCVAKDKNVHNISEYLDSAAGQSLRKYIDGFEINTNTINTTKNEIIKLENISPLKVSCKSLLNSNDFSKIDSDNISEIESPKTFFQTKEISVSCSENDSHTNKYTLRYEHDGEDTFTSRGSSHNFVSSRPPDIIDSFTMYPNFVPDIDLSDKCTLDQDSPQRTPECSSIIISEDEPPIPLKIDKYFEHSPDFFGARITDPNSSNIPSRRPPKRNTRVPKKPDSLTLQSNVKVIKKDEIERASSLPQSHTFTSKSSLSPDKKESLNLQEFDKEVTEATPKVTKNIEEESVKDVEVTSKDYIIRLGRKNSERALQIIQENSQILNRILTKQNITKSVTSQCTEKKYTDEFANKQIPSEPILLDSPLLKESTSDSLIGGIKRNNKEDFTFDKNDFLRVRPISIDDPFCFEVKDVVPIDKDASIKSPKTPSSECLTNKTDYYGWENKGFLAKCDYQKDINLTGSDHENAYIKNNEALNNLDLQYDANLDLDNITRYSSSSELKPSINLPSTENMDSLSYERRLTSDEYNYSFTTPSKYNEYLLSKSSEACSKPVHNVKEQKTSDSLLKSDISDLSDFSQRVTSSISFTCEPSLDDDSPIGGKSNSSDTLCQITSLDQVSTPISPKTFPNKETPVLFKDTNEKSDKNKSEIDDSSTITSLLETDSLSSLSFPRSPSTGSYYPFPTRPSMRLPKDIGVKLGMYPKEAINSPQK